MTVVVVVAMTVVIVIVMVAVVAAIEVVLRRFAAQRLQQLFEFAAVEPHAAATRANVEFDTLSIHLRHADIAVGAGEERHRSGSMAGVSFPM
jgi:hypothetical protein